MLMDLFVCLMTVRRWKKKFESGVAAMKNAPKSGRPKSASRKENVSKIKEIIEGDARFTVRDIARKRWHITINGSPYFEEAFESQKDICQMGATSVDW